MSSFTATELSMLPCILMVHIVIYSHVFVLLNVKKNEESWIVILLSVHNLKRIVKTYEYILQQHIFLTMLSAYKQIVH